MKKLLFGLIAIIIFGFVGNAHEVIEKPNPQVILKNQSFITKLTGLNCNLTKKHPQEIEWTDENVKSDNNSYDYFGLAYSEFLIGLKDYIIKNKSEDKKRNEVLIENYIKSNLSPILSNLSIDKSYLKEDGRLLLIDFADNLNLDNVIEKSKEYEKLVVNNISDANQKKYLLATISAYKWVGYNIFYKNIDKQTVTDLQNKIACARRTGIEYCLCKRLESASEGWTWVDTVQFLLTAAETMAWHLAACTLGN